MFGGHEKCTLFKILVSTAFVIITTHAQKCTTKKDIVFIYELPYHAKSLSRMRAQIKALEGFMSAFQNDGLLTQCNQYKLLAVTNRKSSETIMPFRCDEQCKALAVDRLNDLAENFVNKKESHQKSVFDTLLRLNDVFGISSGGRIEADGVIVLMLTSALKESVVNTAKLLPESYDLIAIGIDAGATTNIEKIVGDKYHYLLVQDIRELLPGKAGFDVVKKLVHSPSYNRFLQSNIFRTDPGCQFIADVAFLIDASGSIRTEYLAQLQFVQYIIASFGIGGGKTRYGVVVFSDGGKYTSLQVGFDEKYDLETLAERIERLNYKGYRTRIDLGFKIAQEELFTKAGGAREGVGKMVFLLTDGKQNPTSDAFGNKYDPIQASQPLVDRGIEIFAIGVGNQTNEEELRRITRSKDKVFFANSANDLRKLNFMEKITKDICKKTNVAGRISVISTTTATTTIEETTTTPPIATNTTAKPKKYTATKQCKQCCDGNNIYINIFNPVNGTTYLLQGVQLGANQNNILQDIQPYKPDVNFNEAGNVPEDNQNIINRIQSLLPHNTDVVNALKKALQKTKRRSRRSTKIRTYGPLRLAEVMKIIKAAGCNLFIAYLEKAGLLRSFLKKSKEMPINIFCPNDDVFRTFLKGKYENGNDVRNVIHGHITKQINEIVYKPFQGWNKTKSYVIRQSLDSNNKIKNIIRNSNISITMRFGSNLTISIIDSILRDDHRITLKKLITLSNLSTMATLLRKSPLLSLLNKEHLTVKKVCFTKTLCVHINGQMKRYYDQLIEAKQFTFQILTDEAFAKMETTKLHRLKTNKKARDKFLLRHIFLGMLQHENNHSRLIAASAMENHPVTELSWSNGRQVVSESEESVYVVDQTFEVEEGLVQILKPYI